MTVVAGDSAPIEVHLADGGHVIVGFADAPSRVAAADDIVQVVLHVDGSEREVEQAIRAHAEALGMACTCSSHDRPTVIVLARA